MSQFEEAGGGLSGEHDMSFSFDVAIPDEPDAAWCIEFMRSYCNGSFRTTLETSYYFKQYPGQENHRRYYSYDCHSSDGDFAKIDGVVAGIKLIADYQGRLIAHAVLTDVEQQAVPFWIAESPQQEFLVPLVHSYGEITLRPEQYDE